MSVLQHKNSELFSGRLEQANFRLRRLARLHWLCVRILRTKVEERLSCDVASDILALFFRLPPASGLLASAIFVVNRKSGRLELLASSGETLLNPSCCKDCRCDDCLCACGQALATQKAVWCSPEKRLDRCNLLPDADEERIVLPLLSGQQPIGLWVLITAGDSGHNRWTEHSLRILAASIGTVLNQSLAARELAENRHRLARASEIAGVGYWSWDITQDRMDWSPEVINMFPPNPTGPPVTLANFLGRVSAEDRKYVEERIKRTRESGRSGEVIHRIHVADGSQRTVRWYGEIMPDAGAGQRMQGIVQDVSSFISFEHELKVMTEVFSNSIEGVTITEPDGTIVHVNPAFTQITGYSPDEVLGKNPRILKSERHDAAFYREMWTKIYKEGKWSGHIWNRRKNGEIYPESLTITSVRDASGRIRNHVAVFHDLSDYQEYQETIHHQLLHNPLTGLPNRRLLLDRIGTAMGRAQTKGVQVGLVAVDIDNFKNINESLGLLAGDQLIRLVATRFHKMFSARVTVAHTGGDDFCFLLEAEDIFLVAQDLAVQVGHAGEEPLALAGQTLRITFSIGIAIAPEHGDNPAELIKNAEIAMYLSKEEGKNSIRFFAPARKEAIQRRLLLENALHQAIDRHEFLVCYQPQISFKHKRIIGVEALLRWRHPELGMISPDEFIPIAEETGIIIPIGQWVLDCACDEILRWRQLGYDLNVAVNLSNRQFRSPNILADLCRSMEKIASCGQSLTIEVTESMLINNEETAIGTLWELKKLGVRVALDDFGTGYSSLYYLKQLPLDYIKIDKSFILDLEKNQDSAVIVKGIISIAHALGLEVVAEGVETEYHLGFLDSLNCNMYQGFFFSRAVPADEVTAMLNKEKQAERKAFSLTPSA